MKGLTIKQEKFCNVYIETGNATEAYRQSYSIRNMKPATINRRATDMMKNGTITARLKVIQSELKKVSDIKKEWILEELSAIVFSDIRDYIKFDGKRISFKNFNELTDRQAKAIESLKHGKYGIELKLHAKSWSIERISKLLGFDAPVKMENEISLLSELESKSDEELIAIIENQTPLGSDDRERE